MAIETLKKLSIIGDGDKITIDDLSRKDENGQTLFEHFLKSQPYIDNTTIMAFLTSNYDYLIAMINNDYFPFEYYNLDLLFDTSRGTPIITLIFQKNKDDIYKLPKVAYSRLFKNPSIVEEFLKINEEECKNIIKKTDDFDSLYQCLKNINRLDLMQYANKNILLHQTPNGKTLLEELIDNNKPVSNIENSSGCADILFQKRKYAELLTFDSRILINNPTREKNYLSLLIEKYQNGENLPFDSIKFSGDSESLAEIYLTLVQNNINFIPPQATDLINESNLNQKPLIVHMLELNKALTIQHFLNDEVLENLRTYIAKRNNIDEKELQALNIDELLNYLPTRENLLAKVKNGQKIDDENLFTDDFLKPFGGEDTLLEYILKNNPDSLRKHELFSSKYSQYYGATPKEIVILLKYNQELPFYPPLSDEALYEKVDDNNLLIDLLLKNVLLDSKNSAFGNTNIGYVLASTNFYDLKIFDYCLKYNCFKIISPSVFAKIFAYNNNSCMALKYLDNDNFISAMEDNGYKIPENIALQLFNQGYKKVLTNVSEQTLLQEANGKIILEDLLDSNINVSLNGFESEQTLDILLKHGRIDLIAKASLELLLNKPSIEHNYLQNMLDNYKVPFINNFSLRYSNDKKLIARIYIQMAKNNLKEALPGLYVERLLEPDENNNCLLDYLMFIDKDLAISNYINEEARKDPRIYIKLKQYGIDVSLIDLSLEEFDLAQMHINEFNRQYDFGMTSPVENLLNELKTLFANDGNSNSDLINSLIRGYRRATCVSQSAISELTTLIDIKRKNPGFYYLLEHGIDKDRGPEFSPVDKCIHVPNNNIDTLLHETGHAIHFYIANLEVPSNYFDIINNTRNKPEFIDRMDEYSKKYHLIKQQIETKSALIVEEFFASKEINDEKIDALLEQKKKEIIGELVEEGYSEEEIEPILTSIFKKDKFLKDAKKIEKEKLVSSIFLTEYDAFLAIGDFLSIVSNGKFRSGTIFNRSGEKIPNISYAHDTFFEPCAKFAEMITEYSVINKSPNANEIIKLLRYYVGDELIDLLDEFYKKNYLSTPVYEDTPSKTM